MPTYDYQCHSCGFISEVVHSMSEKGPTECDRCGGQLRRVFHPTGIIFKGGGFYKTDSRSSSSGSIVGPSRGGAPATPSTDSASSDKSASSEKSSPSSSSGGRAATGDSGGD